MECSFLLLGSHCIVFSLCSVQALVMVEMAGTPCFSSLISQSTLQVQNVRVYVYFPVRGGSNVTALVVWDRLSAVEAGGGVDNYTVRVFNVISGEEVTGVSMLCSTRSISSSYTS